MYLGGGFTGDRLNKIYKENIGEAEILESLKPILINMLKKEMKESISEISLYVQELLKK